MSKYDNLIFIDVEATGNTPHSGEMTEFGAVHYPSRNTFHGVIWEGCTPDPEIPAKPVIGAIAIHNDESKVMNDFFTWIKSNVKSRPVMVSDNPAYDFMWMAYYFDKTLGFNPLGHSARRISDFWAGLNMDWSNTQKWKHFRITKHDHNPVNDSMGNVEAFDRLIKEYTPKKE